MNIADINPDEELKDLLTGQIRVGSRHTVVPVYRDGEIPSESWPEDLLTVDFGGNIRSRTKPMGCLRGTVMVSYLTKLSPSGEVRYSRVKKVLEQFETIVRGAVTEKFFYDVYADDFITPPTASRSTGYSFMHLNVNWHTK